jgi:hypothetical protein
MEMLAPQCPRLRRLSGRAAALYLPCSRTYDSLPPARISEPRENFSHEHHDVDVIDRVGLGFGDRLEFVDRLPPSWASARLLATMYVRR